MEQPQMEFEYVTPERAIAFLTRMPKNRNLRPTQVQQLARALQDGSFNPYNGEPGVKIDTDGTVFDGQHRLRAIVASGVATPLLVIRGLQPEAVDTTNIGSSRSLADMLRLREEKSASTLASAIKGSYRYVHGTLGEPDPRKHNPSIPEALAFLKVYPSIREAVGPTSRYSSRHKDYGAMLTPQSYSTLWWLFSKYDLEQAEYFFDRLTMGDDRDTPIWLLRRSLTNMRYRKGVFFAGEAQHAMALTVKVWNAWNTGYTPRVLKWRPNPNAQAAEPFPDPFGKEIIDEVIAKEAAEHGYIVR